MRATDCVGADGTGLIPGCVFLRLQSRKMTIRLTSLSLIILAICSSAYTPRAKNLVNSEFP